MLPKVMRTSGATRMHSCVRERLTFCDSGFLPLSADPRTAVLLQAVSWFFQPSFSRGKTVRNVIFYWITPGFSIAAARVTADGAGGGRRPHLVRILLRPDGHVVLNRSPSRSS
eukprot:COSAG01_NODE_392_length_17668_cov_5.382264_9_plen_113_part_00